MISIRTTADGSHTLHHEALNENYHSYKGAWTESVYIFIQHGLLAVLGPVREARILEVGFGTGLDALLAGQTALAHPDKVIHYTGLEPYPIPSQLLAELNYVQGLSPDMQQLFGAIHATPWGHPVQHADNFWVEKRQEKLEDFQAADLFDVVFYDAFSPKAQPEIWALANLQKCHDALRPGGCMVTYCAQGQFKRDLRACGFRVEALPGPPGGKKEITRAWKSA